MSDQKNQKDSIIPAVILNIALEARWDEAVDMELARGTQLMYVADGDPGQNTVILRVMEPVAKFDFTPEKVTYHFVTFIDDFGVKDFEEGLQFVGSALCLDKFYQKERRVHVFYKILET